MWIARVDRRYFAGLAVAAVWFAALAAWQATRAPPIAVAAALDLVVTAGGVAYLLGMRGRALAAVIAAGLLAAKLVLGGVLVVAVAVELATLAIVVARIRRARAAWRAAGADRMRSALATVLPALVAELVATELSLVHAALFRWRVRSDGAFRATGSWPLIGGVLAGLTLIEAPLVHLVLVAFGLRTAAWIATALSAYSALWLIGDINLLRSGGVRIDDHTLAIELGTRWRGAIALDQIAGVSRAATAELDLAIATPNVVIALREPAVMTGLFGRRKRATTIALELDDPEAFVSAIAARVIFEVQ